MEAPNSIAATRFAAPTAFQSSKAAGAKPGLYTQKPAIEVGEEFLPGMAGDAHRKRPAVDGAKQSLEVIPQRAASPWGTTS